LLTERKHFIDTIKLIAYRAETSMASLLRDKLSRADDARALLRQIYDTEVDLIPDLENKTLTVRLHHLTLRPPTMKRSAICAINSTPPPPSSRIRNSGWSTSWGHRKFLEIRSSESAEARPPFCGPPCHGADPAPADHAIHPRIARRRPRHW